MTRAGMSVRVFRSWEVERGRRSRHTSIPEITLPGLTRSARGAADALVHGRHAGHVVYVALFALLGASAWAALEGKSRAVELFAANLATEALGLIVTLVLVHRFLERQERALRLRGSLGALRKSGRALGAMVAAWTELVKGGLERAPDPRPTRLEELFAADLTAALAHVDSSESIVVAAAERLAVARDTLRAIVSTYGANLDPVYLGAIDDLTDDPFLALVTDADGLTAPAWAHGGVRSARAVHFERLLVAVDCHNQLARDAARLRDRRTAPRGDGYAPVLPLDSDLHVAESVLPEWWSVAPRPGSLRSVRFRDADIPELDDPKALLDLVTAANSLSAKDFTEMRRPVRGFPVAGPHAQPVNRRRV